MSVVGLQRGEERREAVRGALELVSDEVAAKVRPQTLLKPNFLSNDNPLASTQADACRGVIDFLLSLPNAPEEILIAEGGNEKYSGQAFENFDYPALIDEYDVPIRLVDLHQETHWQETEIELANGCLWKVAMPKTVIDCPCTISVAVAKTHDVLYTTLALKNMIMGTIHKDHRVKVHGYMTHGERERPREMQVLNRNLIRLAEFLTPDISVIDGVKGLQGNGPGGKDAVDFGVAFAGVDVWAVDAICTQAMGFDPMNVGVGVYAHQRGLGVSDPGHIEVRGARVEDVTISFTPHERYPEQLEWREAAVAF
ncbi:DUF362 domain-containing protein [Candidatus Poribacteria bacterium]|jgi:uncharacterized protein (DUF362 family)|nr:DUF362 domain-containing protein [Candidatus Poribacteria bacterium]MBT5535812.1 DUF362 domain-containing protein [Candidatus Poribacteria bacterium]MBT7101367.1 DUF362 domain-containing protein [Candidatus Poribacteria bacterium]MBT7806616.1 DUF362 domain-containing protein [Candidatus Poribacteria bacterium]